MRGMRSEIGWGRFETGAISDVSLTAVSKVGLVLPVIYGSCGEK
mgnify:CR=1 FL=1